MSPYGRFLLHRSGAASPVDNTSIRLRLPTDDRQYRADFMPLDARRRYVDGHEVKLDWFHKAEHRHYVEGDDFRFI